MAKKEKPSWMTFAGVGESVTEIKEETIENAQKEEAAETLAPEKEIPAKEESSEGNDTPATEDPKEGKPAKRKYTVRERSANVREKNVCGEDCHFLQVYVLKGNYDKLTIIANRANTTMKEVVNQAISKAVREYEKKYGEIDTDVLNERSKKIF